MSLSTSSVPTKDQSGDFSIRPPPILPAVKNFEDYSSCKCCDRHQKNRPNKLEQWQETPWQGKSNEEIYRLMAMCDCSCRHLARQICRGCWCMQEEEMEQEK